MRKLALFLAIPAVLALLPSCATTSEGPSAHQAFETWREATANGEADKSFDMLSTRNKGHWLFQRLQASDGPVRRWRAELEGTPKTDLDLWWGFCKRNGGGRADDLPSSVLAHPSLKLLYREYMKSEAEDVKFQMSRLEIVDVYADKRGATVSVRNGAGGTELYGMVIERGQWRIDNHREPLAPSAPQR